jgi:hypothetical protein
MPPFEARREIGALKEEPTQIVEEGGSAALVSVFKIPSKIFAGPQKVNGAYRSRPSAPVPS